MHDSSADFVSEIVLCSLESWDEIWRRNQFLTDGLLRRHPTLRVLFVEPPTDPMHDLRVPRRPVAPRLRNLGYERRLRALRPVKLLPRRVGPLADALLRAQVRAAARALRFSRPMLWVNDVTYAPLIRAARWPGIYDVTDDWLVAPFPEHELRRLGALERVALDDADEVIVCSRGLATTRGRQRSVHLVPNGVDLGHFQRPRARPHDLPPSPTAVYVGSLHDSRLDVELVVALARTLPSLSIVLVGPDSLLPASRARFDAEPAVRLLGPRAYEQVPAYLQHADVIVVPHLVNEFTESLDPIKAYECLGVPTPTVATPVAGFRELADDVTVAGRDAFASAVERVLGGGARVPSTTPPSWDQRVSEVEGVIVQAVRRHETAA